MKLLIDAGNTRLKWCWYDGEDLPLDFKSCEYDDFDAEGTQIFAGEGHDADDVLICNVAGDDAGKDFIDAFSDWQLQPRFFTSQARCFGVTNAYPSAGKLGVDRWLALLGAWAMKKDAVCIVDCGTAVTIDVLDDSGQHLGGMIIPGLEMMQDALSEGTSGITLDDTDEGESEPSLLANNTSSAIEAGTLYAIVALIERVRQDVARELDCELPLLISGGDVDLIQPLLSCEASHEPMLIFHGMIAVDESGDPS